MTMHLGRRPPYPEHDEFGRLTPESIVTETIEEALGAEMLLRLGPNVSVNAQLRDYGARIAVRLRRTLLARRIWTGAKNPVSYPATWWDAVKARWCPAWLRRWAPVRYTTIPQRHETWIACPHLAAADGQEREHVEFLRWGGWTDGPA